MFDLGWSEMVVIGLLALLVIGPKDLPKVMKQVARWVNQIRGMAREFQSSLDDMVKDTEFKDAKDAFDSVRSFRPDSQMKSLIDPDDDLERDLDLEGDLDEATRERPSKPVSASAALSSGTIESPKVEDDKAKAAKPKTQKKAVLKKAPAKKTKTEAKPKAAKAKTTKAAPAAKVKKDADKSA